jgi:hypothetical protein
MWQWRNSQGCSSPPPHQIDRLDIGEKDELRRIVVQYQIAIHMMFVVWAGAPLKDSITRLLTLFFHQSNPPRPLNNGLKTF